MPVTTKEITSDNQEIIPAVENKNVKVLGFWYSVPVSHSIGLRGGENKYPACVVVTDANHQFHGGFFISSETAAKGSVGMINKGVYSYFVGAGTVWVTLFYEYV